MAQAGDTPLQGRTLNPQVHAPFANTPTKAKSVCGEQGGCPRAALAASQEMTVSYHTSPYLRAISFVTLWPLSTSMPGGGGITEQAQDSRGSCFWVRHTGTTNHLNKHPLYFTKYNLSVMLTFVNSVIVTINNSLRTQFCNFLRI